jgi:glutaminyl-tRNA synthetase
MTTEPTPTPEASAPSNFIRNIIDADLAAGKNEGRVITRFPPEPNGYLHIGHCKAICIDFGIAKDYNGICHMRFDDTNPVKEDTEYVNAILNDIKWLGWEWGDKVYWCSDYFEHFYEAAVQLIKDGKAYVDSLTAEEIREHRGTLTEPGKPSPYRDRSVEENLDLFKRMRAGEFPDGAHVLRAKIDMASPNLNMRDPTLYRIRHAHHHRTGDKWCIYPMYDYSHPLNDALEGITYSLCSLEFENHRPLYDWVVENCSDTSRSRPRQIEFARLNLKYIVMSKRKLLELVKTGIVKGWDDPRMPTLAGFRRRGYTPESIRNFVERAGVAKADSWIDISVLEDSLRDDLNPKVKRVMGVLDPLKVVITNYPEDKVEQLEAVYFPDEPARMGSRQVPFSRELYIERDDFMLEPSKKFHRLSPGKEVRLRWAYLLKCEEAIQNEQGEVVELRCTIDPDTLGQNPADGRKVKGTIHWVSARHAVEAEVRLYERLFVVEKPDQEPDYKAVMNPTSLITVTARLEPSLKEAKPGDRFQFERKGYFCVDDDSTAERPVFNRSVTLRDTWAKLVDQGKQ